MFLAIINDTYSEVKAEIAAQRNEFEIGDYFKRGYNNMLGKVLITLLYIVLQIAVQSSVPDSCQARWAGVPRGRPSAPS